MSTLDDAYECVDDVTTPTPMGTDQRWQDIAAQMRFMKHVVNDLISQIESMKTEMERRNGIDNT